MSTNTSNLSEGWDAITRITFLKIKYRGLPGSLISPICIKAPVNGTDLHQIWQVAHLYASQMELPVRLRPFLAIIQKGCRSGGNGGSKFLISPFPLNTRDSIYIG